MRLCLFWRPRLKISTAVRSGPVLDSRPLPNPPCEFPSGCPSRVSFPPDEATATHVRFFPLMRLQPGAAARGQIHRSAWQTNRVHGFCKGPTGTLSCDRIVVVELFGCREDLHGNNAHSRHFFYRHGCAQFSNALRLFTCIVSIATQFLHIFLTTSFLLCVLCFMFRFRGIVGHRPQNPPFLLVLIPN